MQSKVGSFNDLFKDGRFYRVNRFCDGSITLKDGKEFKIHKTILSKGSKYFRTLFKNDFSERNTILEIDGETMDNVLMFLYTGQIFLNKHNVSSIAIAADYLLMEKLLMICGTYASQNICLENCISLLNTSFFVERLQILDYCYRWTQINFGKLVCKSNSKIEELAINVFKRLLQDNSLGVRSENEVWIAIKIWVESSLIERQQFVPGLITYLRLIPEDKSLIASMRDDPLIKEHSVSKAFFEKILKSEIHLPVLSNTIRCPFKIYIFLGHPNYFDDEDTYDIFITYDDQLDIWRKIGETKIHFDSLILMNHQVFMFETFSNIVEVFDLRLQKWFTPNHPQTVRQGYHAVKCKDRIYVMGGNVFMSETIVNETEYFSSSSDTWFNFTPLPPIRISGPAIIDDRMYGVGFTEIPPEMKAFVYDFSFQRWTDIGKPSVFRRNSTVVAFNKQIFVLGGQNLNNDYITMSTEVYDPKTLDWVTAANLPFPYLEPKAVVLENKLIVYDNQIGIRFSPKYPPSMWNNETMIWTVVDADCSLNEVFKYRFCVIEDPLIISELARDNRNPETTWKYTPFNFLSQFSKPEALKIPK